MVMTVKQAGRKRWEKLTKEQRQEVAAAGGKAYWANMTAEERSAEMKRRAQVRVQKRKKGSR